MKHNIEEIRKTIAINQELDKQNEMICKKIGHDEEPVLGNKHTIIRCKRCKQYVAKFPKCSDERNERFGMK